MTKNEKILAGVVTLAVVGGGIYLLTRPKTAVAAPAPSPYPGLPGTTPVSPTSNPVAIGLIAGQPILGPVGVELGAPFTITLPAGGTWAAGAQLPTATNPPGSSGPIAFTYTGPQILTLNWKDSGGTAQATAITLFTLSSTPVPVQPVNITLVPNYTTTGAIPVAVGSTITMSLPAGAQWKSGSITPGANAPVSGGNTPVVVQFSGSTVFNLQWQASDGSSQSSNLAFYSV
jgi:hypothetical protein